MEARPDFQHAISQLVAAGINWTEFKVEGTGTSQDGSKKITISLEVEENTEETHDL